MKHYIGFDIGGTKCACVLADKNGKIISKKRFDTLAARGPEAVITDLISAARELMEENGLSSQDIISAGVSCGGPLDSAKGVIMSPPNLPGWDNIPLARIITESLGVPCKVINDADACALAEWRYGAGRGCENMIFLTFGTGMGAGLILNGKLYSGTGGTAGEVGHIRLSDYGPVGYGKAGSFEGFCSGAGIASLARMMLDACEGDTPLRSGEITAKSVAEAADGGDEFAKSVYEKCGEMLGRGLAVLIDILNPQKIVIGSVYARSGHLMKEKMLEVLSREALPVNLASCEIVPAALGEETGDYAAIGAAEEYGENIK
ncbi:MAG: ROK family protein [Clostridia bacterium]|nr:ROK family protein [Clostridia bacterium]